MAPTKAACLGFGKHTANERSIELFGIWEADLQNTRPESTRSITTQKKSWLEVEPAQRIYSPYVSLVAVVVMIRMMTVVAVPVVV